MSKSHARLDVLLAENEGARLYERLEAPHLVHRTGETPLGKPTYLKPLLMREVLGYEVRSRIGRAPRRFKGYAKAVRFFTDAGSTAIRQKNGSASLR